MSARRPISPISSTRGWPPEAAGRWTCRRWIDGGGMKNRLAFVVVLALLSTGCTGEVLGRMRGFDVLQIIRSQPVLEAVAKGRNVGLVLAGIETLILAFVSWYRIHAGSAWLAVTKDWFLGILLCAYILSTVGTSAGLERWIWDVGIYLGEQFSPSGGFLMENFDKAV